MFYGPSWNEMKKCRGYKRIAVKKKKSGVLRSFALFSVLFHLCAAIALTQVSVVYGHPARETLSFIHLVTLPEEHPPAPAQVEHKAARKIKAAARKEPHKPSLVAPARKTTPQIGKHFPKNSEYGAVSDNAPKGVLVIRGAQKEVVMASAGPVIPVSDEGNGPVFQPMSTDNAAPLSGYSTTEPPEESALSAASAPEPAPEPGNITALDNFSGTGNWTTVSRPIFSKADDAGIGVPIKPDILPGIKILHPSGGIAIRKTIEVSGAVIGEGISSVNVLVNESLLEVPAKDGRFKAEAALEEGINKIRASVRDTHGRTAEDEISIAYNPADIAVSFVFEGLHKYRIINSWTPYPPKPGATPQASGVPDLKEDGRTASFSVSHAAPGIYTVALEYDASQNPAWVSFDTALYGYDPARRRMRSSGPIKLQGKGRLAAVRVLMPEGIFWEDNSWFSGIIRNGSTTIKYKMPEGIIWKENE